MKQNDAQEKKTDRIREFMDVTFQLAEEELQAMHGMIPMTGDLFGRCVRKCEEIGAIRQLRELIAEFPEQYQDYCREQGLGKGQESAETGGAGWPEGPARELRADDMWKKINSQLEKMERS